MKVNQFDPYLGDDEIALVTDTIRRNWITEGERTAEFQELLRRQCGVKHAIMLPNGTLALYAALMSLGVGVGDEVIIPAFTFIGSATAAVLTGAKPVFADVDPEDFNLSVDSAVKCLSTRTKVIMPVHVYGQAANMEGIKDIADRYGLKVVEDAAQGIGVTYGEKHVGSMGDVGCFSFYADKTITMGEGGALVTDSDELAERCMYFKNQGRLVRGSFQHSKIGFNFRVTDLQSAIGVAQFKKLPFILKRKKENERRYQQLLKDLPQVSFPKDNKRGERVLFRVNIMVDDPESLAAFLIKKDIGVRRVFYPLHLQPCFNESNSIRSTPCPHSEALFKRGLSLPSGVGLSDKQIVYVCETIRAYYAM